MTTSSTSDTTEQRPEGYPFTDWQLKLQEAIPKLKGRPRHCAIHAFKGLKRAWKIAEIDPEMAYFRALTAEEEAATALIFALKHRRYPGAEKLDYNYHPHKAGITPFLRAIENVFAESKFPTPSYKLDSEADTPNISLRFKSENLGLPPGYIAEVDQPLNGFFQENTELSPGISIFGSALRKYAENKGSTSVLRVIKEEANIRNRLLYAADNGIPKVDNVDSVLLSKSRPISIMVSLTIAILQTREHQLLVPQALEAYLHIFDRAPDERFDYAAIAEPNVDIQIEIQRNANGSSQTSFRRILKYNYNYNFNINSTKADLFKL
jgi:hypothetical protein